MSGRILRRIRQKALSPDQRLLEITDLGSQEALAFPDGSLAMIPPGWAGGALQAAGLALPLSHRHTCRCVHTGQGLFCSTVLPLLPDWRPCPSISEAFRSDWGALPFNLQK